MQMIYVMVLGCSNNPVLESINITHYFRVSGNLVSPEYIHTYNAPYGGTTIILWSIYHVIPVRNILIQ